MTEVMLAEVCIADAASSPCADVANCVDAAVLALPSEPARIKAEEA